MVVVISLAFVNQLNPLTWIIIYWLIILFVAINAIAKSFISERPGQLLYLYSLVHPISVILAKIIYNSVLLSIISFLAWFLYAGLSEVDMADPKLFAIIIFLGSCAFATNLTLVSAIAAKAENKTTLLAVLSFPLIVPVLLTLIKISRFAIEGLDKDLGLDQLVILGGISLLLMLVSAILFPVIWRE